MIVKGVADAQVRDRGKRLGLGGGGVEGPGGGN